MRLRASWLGALAVVLSVSSAYGYRREYRITWQDQRKPGSEVCFYRGGSGDAFSLFFLDNHVVCLPADDVLDFPPGRFHAFARHRDGYVSAHRDYFAYPDPPRPERGYEILETPLVKAGYLDFSDVVPSIAPGQSVGVWLAPTANTLGTWFPLVSGEKTIMVPSETPVLPLVVEHGMPVAVGDLLYLAAGERQRVAELSAKAGPVVVAWISLDKKAAAGSEGLLQPAEIVLTSQKKTFKPLYPLYDGQDSNTLVFFKNVPGGAAELRVNGRLWRPTHLPFEVAANGVTVVREPISLVPAGALTVSWSNAGSENKPQISDSCPADHSLEASVASVLSRCVQDGSVENCVRVGSRTVAYSQGSVEFYGLEAGRYTAEVRLPMSKTASASASVVVGRTAAAQLKAPETFKFFGQVTVNGKPVASRLLFESGEARSDETGAYVATLAADPLTNIVYIVVCPDPRVVRFVPRERPQPNAPFDIAIDVNKLTVHVVNGKEQPVPAASAFFGLVKSIQPDNTTYYYTSPSLVTDDEGETVFENVPTADGVVVCVSHRDYPKKCTEPLTKHDVAEGRVVVQLGEALGVHGRVVGHEGRGTLNVIQMGGAIVEQVPISQDGTFSLSALPQSPQYVIYVSTRRPLTVLPLSPEWQPGSDLIIPLPTVPVRSFTVHLDGVGKEGLVGVWVGGSYVPARVLAMHQDSRGFDVRVKPGRSLRIADVAETAPIAVAFAPEDENAKVFVDVLTLPEYASIHRSLVTTTELTIHPP